MVGGGLVGSSIAYQLAKSGLKTLLVEQGELASGASGANFGNVQVQDADFGFSLELTIAGGKTLRRAWNLNWISSWITATLDRCC